MRRTIVVGPWLGLGPAVGQLPGGGSVSSLDQECSNRSVRSRSLCHNLSREQAGQIQCGRQINESNHKDSNGHDSARSVR